MFYCYLAAILVKIQGYQTDTGGIKYAYAGGALPGGLAAWEPAPPGRAKRVDRCECHPV